MAKQRARSGLLILIGLEFLGAAAVVWWLFGPSAQDQATETTVTAPAPMGTFVAEDVPTALRDYLQGWVASRSDELIWAEPSSADLIVDWHERPSALPLSRVVLVPVAPFPSPRDKVDADELRCTWLDRPCPENSVSRLLVPRGTTAALDTLFGPRNAEALVTVVPIDDLPDHLWADPTAVAIVPFDRLEPRLKALSVDGQLALDRDVDLRRYPLLATVWARGPKELVDSLAPQVQEQGLDTNRRPDRLTVLTMTGVTALTRRVALQIEAHRDYGWPARHLVDLLSTADLTHISHEVSFVSGCQAQRKPTGLCAKPEYMKTLQLVGADLVELTGNHNLDFGPYHALQSLDLYAQAGMRTFGGGQNAAQARRPLLVTHNGNRLAFLGYNQFGPDYAWATDSRPGAAPFSLEAVRMDLAQVRPEADLIFVNIQHTETYSTVPLPAQVADFRAVVEAGANAVTGSQAHQPQAIEFHDRGLIFYGLGNLMFDQTWSVPTRQSLVIRHVIYDGRLIATQLIPTVFDDNCQPRPAEDSERKAILQAVFEASGW